MKYAGKKLWRNIYPRRDKLIIGDSEDRHEHRVGFPIHRGGIPTSLQQTHYHSSEGITVIQAYAPTTDYDDDDIEDIYDQLQEVIDQAPKKDILVVQSDWMQI